ncbi:EAL domain-containing protein (putative c-di-GMP-specific phosphodiesterase class I) [Idiomarina fontislapidosi]|uniref:EAL domain-containing protein n=1 Tax=Idiomarina fontislapidosi TaxID=263723 RepID=A0A432YAR6_9GAMM|nr:EAL domain-containing response regulator [Idiomarina fontislapidosi]PYE35173.1 EAL domain-containing protein (putative c-di-GMP-specific phosphodiesterase class I) [Idiomarina fontislapidosi]RUO58068.1 hypothetical protein CWE25_00250 [Idiomarina fontislapidosi]
MSQPPRLLVLDDQAFIGQAIKHILSGCECECEFTTKPCKFFGLIASGQFTHLLIDLLMPDMASEQVIMMLTRMRCKLPIIIMSGGDASILQTAAVNAQEQGLQVLGTLSKPFSKEALLAIIKHKSRPNLAPTLSSSNTLSFDAVDIKFALSARQFYCVYQPKICLLTDKTIGFKSLLRWQRPDNGVLHSEDFLAIAETLAVVDSLTYYEINESLAWLANLQSRIANTSMTMAISISIHVLAKAELGNVLHSTCVRHKLKPEQIVIEAPITIANHVSALEHLTRLRQNGFQVALDLPKVSDETEHHQTIQQLKALGCELLQDFYYAKPMQPAQAEDWFSKKLGSESARRSDIFSEITENQTIQFNYITAFIHQFMGFEIALVSLLEQNSVYIKAPVGLDHQCVAVENSLCLHVMNNNAVTVFEDLTQRPDVTQSMLSSMRDKVKFYAGFPFWGDNRLFIGSVCVMGSEPYQLTQRELSVLDSLARLVEFDVAHRTLSTAGQPAQLAIAVKRLNKIIDIAKQLRLHLTMIRLTFATSEANQLNSKVLNQQIRPWDIITPLSETTLLVTLQHRVMAPEINALCERLFAHTELAEKLEQTEYATFSGIELTNIQTQLTALKPHPINASTR